MASTTTILNSSVISCMNDEICFIRRSTLASVPVCTAPHSQEKKKMMMMRGGAGGAGEERGYGSRQQTYSIHRERERDAHTHTHTNKHKNTKTQKHKTRAQ